MKTDEHSQAGQFEALYNQLNPAQKEAVDTIEGPVVVIAGPGTGKTQVLTLRIANILRRAGAGVGAENILALTFTNAAVKALRERLLRVAGSELAYQTNIFTFHSFSEELMKRYPEYFANFFGATPVSDLERLQIIEALVEQGKYRLLKTFASTTHHTKAIRSAIDTLKREGITPDDFVARIASQEKDILADEDSYYKRSGKNYQKGDLKPDVLKVTAKNKELAEVYRQYEKALKTRRKYDYNDTLLAVITALGEHPDFQASLLEQYQYILVDEHQDTNGAQNRILELLTDTPHDAPPNLFTVGDDKQAIYRFQGASLENFLHFAKRFEGTKIIDLTYNYRSTQPVLKVAERLIENDPSRKHTPLEAQTTISHENISVECFATPLAELAFLAEDCRQKIAKGVKPETIAIFYRENKFLAGLQEVLAKQGVPYVVVSKENILHDPVMRKLLWLLRAVANPLDNERLGEVLLMDVVDIEPLDALMLFDELRYGRKRKSLLRLLRTASTLEHVEFQNPQKLERFAQFVEEQKVKGENLPFIEFFDAFVRESGFLRYLLAKPESQVHIRQLGAFLEEIRKVVSEKPVYRLGDFLAYVEALLQYDVPIDAAASSIMSGVQLMTAHGAKGLEFDHVYITDAVSGRWNNKRQMNFFTLPVVTDKTSTEDDRRLFYVALTRAKKNITITYALVNADGKPQEPSRFVTEILGEHVTVKQSANTAVKAEQLFAPRTSFLPALTSLEYIRERFFSLKLSATALNNYFKHPIVYFFCNLLRLPTTPTKSILYGNVVHKALELFFQESKRAGSILPVERLLELYEGALERSYLLHEYYEEFASRGREHLLGYYQARCHDWSLDIETEKRLSGIGFSLNTKEELMLTGVLDKLEYLSDGTVRVVDYKTGKTWSEKSKEEKELLRRQIVFYKLLVDAHQERGKTLVMSEGLLDFVEPNKKGIYEQERIVVTQADCERLKQEVNDFAESVLSGAFLQKEVPINQHTKEFIDLLSILEGEA